MNRIDGLSSSNAVHRAVNSLPPRTAAAEPAQAPVTDRLELSGTDEYLQALRQQDGVRAERIAAIRQQIDAGTYVTPEKIDVAVDRLLDALSR
jgi:negative regulator of flagellin synthesis FlgM